MKSPIHPAPAAQAMPVAEAASGADETSAFTLRWAGPGRDRPGAWLQCAAGGLCVLAAAAAAVSFTACRAVPPGEPEGERKKLTRVLEVTMNGPFG